MNQSEVEQFVENSFREGYSIKQIKEVLKEEDVDPQTMQAALNNLKNKLREQNSTDQQNQVPENQETIQNKGKSLENSQEQRNRSNQRQNEAQQNNPGQKSNQSKKAHENVIQNINLTGDNYTIKQRFFFNRYHVYSGSELILKAKQKLFKLKENFPLMNKNNEVVARVKAESIIDAGGDYTVMDEASENPIAVLDRKYTLFRHKWKIRDPKTEEKLANVESSKKTVELLRWLGNLIPFFPNVLGLIPHTYEITDRNNQVLARLRGEFHLRDVYSLEVEKAGGIPKEALVASAIAIDALEGN